MQTPTPRRFLPFVLLAILMAAAAPAVAGQPAGFTVVLLPDTQVYSEKLPDTYVAQTEWIRGRAAADNIKFVIHLGDMVENATAEEEWKNADRAHRVLDGVVPYSVLPGNHDGAPDNTQLFNKYFPPKRFAGHRWYGGHLGETNDNNYCVFDAAGMKFLVLSLGYRPGDEALAWADKIVQEHRDHRVIVATHDYMNAEKRRPPGEKIWKQLVRKHKNIFMVVCGHIGAAAQQISTNDADGVVHEILCDYQNRPRGGDGWLQTLRFLPDENRIRIEAHSPLVQQPATDRKPLATLAYDMSH